MWPFSRSSTSSTQISLQVEGMHCVSCGLNIDGTLEDIPGVHKAQTDYARGETRIQFDESQVNVQELTKAIKKLGYTPKTSR